jgi:two-component system CheB/CheR fusion protein
LGASAGGLQALEDAPDSGLAYVVVTHQHPERVSLMPDLLRSHTSLPVQEVTNGTQVLPNSIYLAPAGGYLALDHRYRLVVTTNG